MRSLNPLQFHRMNENPSELKLLHLLKVGRNKLTGSFPDHIQSLRHMNVLAMDHNKLKGALPDGLWCLELLKKMYICSNSLELSVLKRSVPKMPVFAFGSHLRSQIQRSKTRVLGRRLPNGKPQKRLRFRDLRSKTLAFKKRIAIVSFVLEASLGARACVQVSCVKKNAAFCVCVLKPTKVSKGVCQKGSAQCRSCMS